jgi:transcriptional regulator with XRE-family HTH domain
MLPLYSNCKSMPKELNRLKVVLAEKKVTNRLLAEKLGKDEATVSKWCTNNLQPNLETLIRISEILGVEVQELIRV